MQEIVSQPMKQMAKRAEDNFLPHGALFPCEVFRRLNVQRGTA
jgi:hypothetical protein